MKLAIELSNYLKNNQASYMHPKTEEFFFKNVMILA